MEPIKTFVYEDGQRKEKRFDAKIFILTGRLIPEDMITDEQRKQVDQIYQKTITKIDNMFDF